VPAASRSRRWPPGAGRRRMPATSRLPRARARRTALGAARDGGARPPGTRIDL